MLLRSFIQTCLYRTRYVLCVLCWLLLPGRSLAQGENNIWAFGMGAGLDFTTGVPQFLPSKTTTGEGCATVCAPNGQLLFYSDGNRVWDRNHNLMPNGSGLLGNSGGFSKNGSSTQGVAIIPFPADTNKYYLFTLDCFEAITASYTGYLRYSVIDMSLNSGLGDVVSAKKNIVLDDFMSERMTVAKGSGCFYWLITHRHSSNEFRAYRVDDNGIGPRVSSFTSSFTANEINSNGNAYMIGELKISPDQKRLASAANFPHAVELYAFDNRTGAVTRPLRVYDGYGILYGVSFSPDNTKLYVSRRDYLGKPKLSLLQFDLSLLPDETAVKNSGIPVGDTATYSGMRLGPGGRLYIAGYNINDMHVVNNPNLRGNACDVQPLSFAVIDTIQYQMGFGNHVYSRLSLNVHTGTRTDTAFCFEGNSLTLHAPPGFGNYSWNTGELSSSIDITKAGDYRVISSGFCGSVTDAFNVTAACADCVYIPSAFSPNNDGRNDHFGAIGKDITDVFMMVYNRWGNQVFISTDASYRWDGSYKGKPCEPGTYFYTLTAKCRGGKPFTRKGDVTLVR